MLRGVDVSGDLSRSTVWNSPRVKERDLFRLACNACWEILECVEWGTVVLLQLSGCTEHKKPDVSALPLCLSPCLSFFSFLVVVFELLFFRVQIKQRWLKANEIFYLFFFKKGGKKAHLHFITYMKSSIVRGAAHEMCFSPLCNAALGLLCFIKLKLMFVECHWNHSLRKD